MTIAELFLIGVGLSMDAFAAAVCKGLEMKKINYTYSFITALFFGGFQALMPLVGYILGTRFEKYIMDFDHWIAFILLGFIGGKMVYEVIKGSDDEEISRNENGKLDIGELFMLAVATSIDALAVGITFAFFDVNIWLAILIIGATTFILSFAGVAVGNRFGRKYKSKAEFAGGIILIIIGVKILFEHLGIISI